MLENQFKFIKKHNLFLFVCQSPREMEETHSNFRFRSDELKVAECYGRFKNKIAAPKN